MAYLYESRMEATDCCVCGTPFAFPALQARRRDGAYFHCPNGHSQRFTETLDVKLRRELNEANDARYKAEDERDRLLRKLKRLKRKKR